MFSKGLVEGFLFQRLWYNRRQSYVGEGIAANTKPQIQNLKGHRRPGQRWNFHRCWNDARATQEWIQHEASSLPFTEL